MSFPQTLKPFNEQKLRMLNLHQCKFKIESLRSSREIANFNKRNVNHICKEISTLIREYHRCFYYKPVNAVKLHELENNWNYFVNEYNSFIEALE